MLSSARRWLETDAEIGGRGEIRTRGTVTRTPDFESGAFNHSATLPLLLYFRGSNAISATPKIRGKILWKTPAGPNRFSGLAAESNNIMSTVFKIRLRCNQLVTIILPARALFSRARSFIPIKCLMIMDEKEPIQKPAPGKEAPSGKHSRRWPWVLAILIVVLGLIAFFNHRNASQQTSRGRRGASQAIMISTITAWKGDMPVYINALGTVTPVYTVSVAARVAGQIVKVEYRQGQDVQIGDPLVDIDPRPYQAAVLQAQGQLEHDQALLADANIDLERYKEAYESNAIPQQQYQTQQATVQQDEGSVDLDEGNLSNALVNLDYCHITSPIKGRVGLRLVDPGNIVQANGTTPLAVVAQLQPITVIFTVAENSLPPILAAIHQGNKLKMEVYDSVDTTRIDTGTLEALDNEIDPTSGTLKLRGVCPNEDESLIPNQFVNVHLLYDTLEDQTLLPNSAIQRNSESAYVYLVKRPEGGQTNYTAQIQNITAGATDGTNSVVEGISPGDVVATDNFNRLTDGASVVLRPSEGQPGGTESSPGQAYGKHHEGSPKNSQ
jgi:membrane fusion protein, multidrug efflux system